MVYNSTFSIFKVALMAYTENWICLRENSNVIVPVRKASLAIMHLLVNVGLSPSKKIVLFALMKPL